MTLTPNPTLAAADEDWAACAATGISIESSPSAEWRAAVLGLCKEFRSIPDLDPGAAVHLSGVGKELEIAVWLQDGRRAQRRIRSPEALRDVVEALVVIPPGPRPTNDFVPYALEPSVQSERAPQGARLLQVELGGSVVGRSSRSPSYLSVGGTASAGVHWGNWLFGLELKFQPWTRASAGSVPGFEMSTAGLGFMLGRELFEASSARLDAALTTTLLTEAQSVQPAEREVSATEGDVRVGALARCLLGSSPLRLALSLDAEFSPARIGREIRAAEALPPLPSWSLGLGLGAAWLEP